MPPGSQVAKHDLAALVAAADRYAVEAYNAKAAPDFRLRTDVGPLVHAGDIETAPVVVLDAQPVHHPSLTREDHAFARDGWALAALHPQAPLPLRRIWQDRLAGLIDRFGAEHVANSIALLPLTPWASVRHDPDLRLPSREHVLGMAGALARRGAILILLRSEAPWLDSPDVAALPPSRRIHARSWQTSQLRVGNFGVGMWRHVRRGVDAHIRSRARATKDGGEPRDPAEATRAIHLTA